MKEVIEEEVLQGRRRKYLPQELRQLLYNEALALHKNGYGYKKISKELRKKFGKSAAITTLSYWIRGYTTPYYVRKKPPTERAEAYRRTLELRSKGFGSKRIFRILHKEGYRVGLSTVKDWIAGKYSPFGPNPPVPIPTPKVRETRRSQKIEPCPELSYVVGVILGDGSVYRDRDSKVIVLRTIDKEFAETFAVNITIVLQRENQVKVNYNKRRNLYWVKVKSSALYELLKNKDLSTLKPIIEHCDACVAMFLRGFVDSEGSVKEGTVVIYNTNYETLCYIKYLFERLSIRTTGPHLVYRAGTSVYDPRTGKEYKRRKDLYKLCISRRSAQTFLEKVGLTIERKRRKLEEYLKKKNLRKRKPHPPSLPPIYTGFGLPLSAFLTIYTLYGKV